MKKHLQHISVIVIGALFMVSCGTYNTAYVDDIYYNPKKEARKKAKNAQKIAELKVAALVDTTQTDSSEFFFSDYNDNEYADRINKFHNDEYQGEYYDDNQSWNTSVGIGFSPYGSSFSVGFGYGYNPWYYPYYSYYPYMDPFYYGYYSPWGYPYYSHHYWHHHYNCWGDYAYYPGYPSYPSYPGNPDNGRGSYYGQRHSAGSGSPLNTTTQGNGNTRKNTNVAPGSVNNANEIKEDLAPMGVMSATRKQSKPTSSQTESPGAVQRIGSAASTKSVSNNANQTSTIGAARKATLIDDNYKKPDAVSRTTVTKNKVAVPTYTRTSSEAKKSIPASSSRNGYTPSYTRTRSNASTDNYNTGTTYKRQAVGSTTRTVAPARSTSVGSVSRSYSRPSSSSTYQSTAPSTTSKPRSSYAAPSRSSSPSYSKPSSGSSSRSSGSSYSTPSRSSSSSPRRSSSSGSSSGSSSSSPTRKGR